MRTVESLYEAVRDGKTFVTPQGHECIVVKIKLGKVKVRREEARIEGDKIHHFTLESGWIPIEALEVKED